MIPKLKIAQMTYPRESELGWKKSGAMLASSQASKYLKEILTGKVSRRGGGTRRFFGEAYVATQIAHAEGYYGSFQWLTSPMFLGDRPFPQGLTKDFQQQYRSALQRHFADELDLLQRNARKLAKSTRVRPAAPDLWLVESSGHHRFLEVKLPHDQVSDSQIAGLAVIAKSFGPSKNVSVEIVELHPDRESRFAEFIRLLDGAG
jgi:hypothetical protein